MSGVGAEPSGTSFHAVVPAAGSGSRFGDGLPKQFHLVAGRPLVAWAVERLLAGGARSIAVALPADRLDELGPSISTDPVVRFVAGGASRQESVAGALAASPAKEDELVAVHDGARPALHTDDLAAVLRVAMERGAAVLGRPVSDTLKRVEASMIVATTDRAGLFRAETPQVFRRRLLERALDEARRASIEGTDESALVERLGTAVAAVEARHPNPKVTRAGDLAWIEPLLRSEEERSHRPSLRIGHGYDVHRLVAGRRLVLGGEEIPHPAGLEGHSDADVLLHALADALLGAAGLGDLGAFFPPSDPKWRGAASTDLLEIVVREVRSAGFAVENVDLVLIAEAPRLAPFRERIRERLAAILGVEVGAVGLKATTNEQLGFVGREEGMAATAVALLCRVRGSR